MAIDRLHKPIGIQCPTLRRKGSDLANRMYSRIGSTASLDLNGVPHHFADCFGNDLLNR
jgi:hypothetical protein